MWLGNVAIKAMIAMSTCCLHNEIDMHGVVRRDSVKLTVLQCSSRSAYIMRAFDTFNINHFPPEKQSGFRCSKEGAPSSLLLAASSKEISRGAAGMGASWALFTDRAGWAVGQGPPFRGSQEPIARNSRWKQPGNANFAEAPQQRQLTRRRAFGHQNINNNASFASRNSRNRFRMAR